MWNVPILVTPVLAEGSLSRVPQPSIPIDDVASLRPWNLDDADALAMAFQDPLIQQWHARRADTVDEARCWIARWQDDWSKESHCHWAVVDPRSDALLGRVALKALDLADGIAGLAYWTVASARGHGLCTRAATALCTWAFDIGFHRNETEHSTANPASCRVATKAGLRPEGVRRQAALHADGWHDMHVHSLLADD